MVLLPARLHYVLALLLLVVVTALYLARDVEGTTPSSTATLQPGYAIWGDTDCQNGIQPNDALLVVAYVAGVQLPTTTGTTQCPNVGDELPDFGGLITLVWGDVLCLGGVDIQDVLAVLRFSGYIDPTPWVCPHVGETVRVTD